MRVRQMTSVWIHRGDEVLLLLRRGSRVIPDSYVGIGGHLDDNETADPAQGALRELREEVGLTEDDLMDFGLRCVAMREMGDEVRINYYFAGRLRKDREAPITCTEGELRWFPLDAAFDDLPMPPTGRAALVDWITRGRPTDGIRFVAVDKADAVVVQHGGGAGVLRNAVQSAADRARALNDAVDFAEAAFARRAHGATADEIAVELGVTHDVATRLLAGHLPLGALIRSAEYSADDAHAVARRRAAFRDAAVDENAATGG